MKKVYKRFLSDEWVLETINEYYKKGEDAIGAFNKLTQASKEVWQEEYEGIDDITVILAFSDEFYLHVQVQQ